MKRRHFLGFIIDGQTGKIFHSAVIKKADFDDYERKLRRRETTRAVTAMFIALVLVIGFVRLVWFLASGN